MTNVLVVEDSAVIREFLIHVLSSDPTIQVIGTASNGLEALEAVRQKRPDVITMDIHMPRLDGLEAIREIMAEHPIPIVVVTSIDLEREVGLVTKATKLGAVAVLKRPASLSSDEYGAFASKLIQQVKSMSSVRMVHRARSLDAVSLASPTSRPTAAGLASAPPLALSTTPDIAPTKTEIVAIGSSTGGPAALHKILSAMPKNFSLPILIVQHISFGFVDGLASWLDDASPLHVQVAKLGDRVEPGNVYIAPDDQHLTIDRFKRIGLNSNPAIGGHRPAVTALFQSLAQAFGASGLAVILTGMGADGATGMKALRERGAITLAQDQASCVVFGMPKEAIVLGAIRHVVPLDLMARRIQDLMVG